MYGSGYFLTMGLLLARYGFVLSQATKPLGKAVRKEMQIWDVRSFELENGVEVHIFRTGG